MPALKKIIVDRIYYIIALIILLALAPSFIKFRSEVKISFEQNSPATNYTIYYRFEKEDIFSEELTINQVVDPKADKVFITIPTTRDLYAIRLDPEGIKGNFKIRDLKIFGADQINISYKLVKNAQSNDVKNLSKIKDGFSFDVFGTDPYFGFDGLEIAPLRAVDIDLINLLWRSFLLFGTAFALDKIFSLARSENLSIPKTFFLILISLCLSAGIFMATNDEMAELEYRLLARFPQVFKDDGFNTQIIPEFESWLNDQFGLRDQLLQLPVFLNGRVFDIIPIDRDVVKGADDFWFITQLSTIGNIHGTNQMSEDELAITIAPYIYMRDQLAEHDIPFAVLIGPNKQEIYPEKYPTTLVHHDLPTAADQVIAALRAEDVFVMYPKQNLLDHKQEDLLFVKSDTHMSQLGQYYFIQETLQTLSAQDPSIKIKPLSDFKLERLADSKVIHDLERFAMRYNYGTETFPLLIDQNSGSITRTIIPYEPPYILDHAIYNNPNGNGSVIILGDSFFSSIAQQMFAFSYETTEYIFVSDYASHLPAIIDADPDLVIMERVERAADWIVK